MAELAQRYSVTRNTDRAASQPGRSSGVIHPGIARPPCAGDCARGPLRRVLKAQPSSAPVCKAGQMQWQPDEAFLRGLDFFGGAVSELDMADWDRASPCRDWRALDVLGHVGQATRFGTLLLQDAQPAWSPVEPPGALVESKPEPWWQELAAQARSAVTGVDLSREVDSPMGRRSIGEGLSFPALDLFIHAWDIGKSAGIDLELPAEAIEFARSIVDPIPAEQVRNPRVFAAEKPAPAGATASQAFIAWTGRDPNWRTAS